MEGTIRNIAVIGHSGEGKTTLVEAILFNAGAIDRQGRVDDGNTVSDFDQEEIARKTSISLSVSRCEYTDRKGRHVAFNLVDVPGFFDFEGESNQALSAVDNRYGRERNAHRRYRKSYRILLSAQNPVVTLYKRTRQRQRELY